MINEKRNKKRQRKKQSSKSAVGCRFPPAIFTRGKIIDMGYLRFFQCGIPDCLSHLWTDSWGLKMLFNTLFSFLSPMNSSYDREE